MTEINRKNTDWVQYLREKGVNPTRPRVALARILFSAPHFHFRAEELFAMAKKDHEISLATIYNTLEIFHKAGLLKAIQLSTHLIYDTNNNDHFHFYDEGTGQLIDINPDHLDISKIPNIPQGKSLKSLDVILRIA